MYSAPRLGTRASFIRSLISCMRLAILRETKKECPKQAHGGDGYCLSNRTHPLPLGALAQTTSLQFSKKKLTMEPLGWSESTSLKLRTARFTSASTIGRNCQWVIDDTWARARRARSWRKRMRGTEDPRTVR